MIRNDSFRLLAVLAGVATLSAPAFAGDVHCPPNLGAVTIDGNVLIAAPCRLDGTTVKGNVHLYAGGSLIARGAVHIEGSIQAENADFIDVDAASVNGSIQLKELVGDRSIIARTKVGGGVQLESNRSRLELLASEVKADVQAFSNTGGVVIADNVIDGNLQCKSNSPPPAGGNNRVQGNKEDQCASLQPESAAGAGTGVAVGATGLSSSGGSGGGGGSMGLLASLALALSMLLGRKARGAQVLAG